MGEKPIAVDLAQFVAIASDSDQFGIAILDVKVDEAAATVAAVAFDLETHIDDHVAYLRTVPGVLVIVTEFAQPIVPGMRAVDRAFEDAVRGKAADPVFKATLIDGDGVSGVKFAYLLAVFEAALDKRHGLYSLP